MKKILLGISAILIAVFSLGNINFKQSTPDYIIISRAELMSRPTSGAAWDSIMVRANANAIPDLCNQDNNADINALANGIVFARTGNTAYRNRAIDLINRAVASQRNGCNNAVLAMGRQLGGYVMAADFAGYRDTSFTSWLDKILDQEIGGHGRWHVLRFTAYDSASNWGIHALASTTTADIYLNNVTDIEKDWKVFSSYGVPHGWPFNKASSFNQQWSCEPTDASGKLPIAINYPCVKSGINLDGAPVEDSSRSAFGSYSSYIHESMQGYAVMAQLFERTGRAGWTVNDSQICRAIKFGNRVGRLNDSSVSYFVSYMGNAFCGLNLPTKSPTSNGRMFAFSDWLFTGSSVPPTSTPIAASVTPSRTVTTTPTQVLAFPGAEGFGANTVGGRGGTIYEVTTTNDSGAGSLRECVEASGARTCVFRTGGLIVLNSPLVISNPFITIAGQTAPGGGITIKLGNAENAILTMTHDVIIRYVTVRPGAGGENHGNQIANNGVEVYNVVIDHNSYSWGVDSNLDTWYRVNNVTVQWSIFSEALNCSTHPKGCHSKGLMIGGYKGSESGDIGSENVSVLNNLMAHNLDRNPLIQICGTGQVVNNITYNAGTTFSHQKLNCPLGVSYVNWINNYHKKGSGGAQTDFKIIPSDGGVCGLGKTYLAGNVGNNGVWTQSMSGACAGRTDIIVTTPATAPLVITTSALDAYNADLANAGNSQGISCDGTWYNRRDSIDTRIINDVINGTGNIIDDPSQVGGWIVPLAGVGCGDTDHDGMPDAFEQRYGVASSNVDTDADGYTNVEEYLNGTSPVGSVIPTVPTNTTVPTITLTRTPTPTLTPTVTRTPTPTVTPYFIFVNGTSIPCSKPCRIEIP